MVCVSGWEAVEDIEKQTKVICRCYVCVWERGPMGNNADCAPKNDNAWIKIENASTNPLSHTGLVSGNLVNNFPVNFRHKQLLKMENILNVVRMFVCTFEIIEIFVTPVIITSFGWVSRFIFN